MIVPATLEHVQQLRCTLPGLDQYWRSLRVSHEQGMQQALSGAMEAYAWLTPEVGAIFGLTYPSLLDAPVFWLFPGEQVSKQRITFLKECRRLRPYFLGKYPIITGYCNIAFKESERWLKWMGASLGPVQEADGLQLSRFYVQE